MLSEHYSLMVENKSYGVTGILEYPRGQHLNVYSLYIIINYVYILWCFDVGITIQINKLCCEQIMIKRSWTGFFNAQVWYIIIYI